MDFSRLTVERGGGSDSEVVVRLGGELDMADAEALRELLCEASGDAQRVVVDLAGLTFVDSSGFLALHDAHEAAARRGGRIVFVSPAPAVARIVELMSFDHLEFTDDRTTLDGRPGRDGGHA